MIEYNKNKRSVMLYDVCVLQVVSFNPLLEVKNNKLVYKINQR